MEGNTLYFLVQDIAKLEPCAPVTVHRKAGLQSKVCIAGQRRIHGRTLRHGVKRDSCFPSASEEAVHRLYIGSKCGRPEEVLLQLGLGIGF